MKICILTIATNKYIQFVERLLDNIEENFLNGHEIQCLLFTDHEIEESSDNVRISQIEHEPWPMPTLKRYNYFMKEKEFISQFDYCFYFDVDMGLVDKVGDEVLSDLVATQHPYQTFYPKDQRSYDRNPKSLAYVAEGEEGENYYAGGFNGGSTKEFLKMSEVIAERVNKDLENDIISLWHDESHMNRYLIDNPPTLSLTPSYCFAEEQMGNPDYPFEPKIIALKKNHNELRS
jgi:histo-blood group ABO system transferase